MNKILVPLFLLVLTATSCRQIDFNDFNNNNEGLLNYILVLGGLYDAAITPAVTGPTNASPINLTITFTVPVTGFDASDVTIGGTGSATVDSVVMVGADGTTYTITITPTADGEITVGVIDAAALKPDGTPTGAVRTATVIYDTAVNAVNVSIASNNANGSFARVGDRITLSFTANEQLVTPAATVNGNTATIAGGPVNWTAAYVMTAGDTEGLITYGITGIQDLAGNAAADISDTSTITFDRTAPGINSASIASSNANAAYAITGDVVTLTFSSDAEIQTPTVSISGRSITSPNLSTADNINWTATCVMLATDAQGTVAFSISGLRDYAGNTAANVTATTDATSVTFDRTQPGVTINQGGAQADPTGSLPIGFDVVFSEPIDPATFSDTEINQNGTATGVTWALANSGDDTAWTLTATAATGHGTIIPSIDAGAVTDVAGNGNTASTATDNSVFYCSDNNTIDDITVTPPALSWDNAFAAAILTYSINVDASQSTIDIAVTLADANASVTIDGTPGLTSTVTLGAVGSTTIIEVLATSQCGTTGSTYTLNVNRASPDINVQAGGSDVGTYDFGSSNIGVPVGPTTFTIQNTGTDPLTVSGFSLSAGDFSGSLATPVVIPGSGTETFDITFTPTTTGLRSATIDLTSDDPDEGTYTITLNGTGTGPDINVQAGGSDVGTHDFGSSNVGVAVGPTTFTIQNTGDGPLTVSGFSLSAGDFSGSLATPVTIPASGSETFDITFTPTTTGARSATIDLTSDDPDEGTYTITLNGTGTEPD
ncbi:MAG: choice-of-anchor D domain-containing protein, partial [Spirochaetes bacterium]|nr:choice-of-anchor D domain-containing protein [Spirochaetota bacterium]